MIEQVSQNYYYPNLMGRSLLRALEEIIGKQGLVALISAAELPEWIESLPPKNLERQFDFDHISRLQATLEKLYGTQCGQGLALRSGRVFFNSLQREFGAQIGLKDNEFLLLPQVKKLQRGLQMLASTFNRYSDQQVRLVDGEQLAWVVDRCPLCWQRHTHAPDCHLMVGFIQEAMYWISGGRQFHVEEKTCLAAGDPSCTLTIDRVPIE
jgi:predicted hydrocarbon binding protein